MRVLVTGGAGFIGAHVVHALLDGGHHPVILDRLDFGVHPFLAGLPLAIIEGDVTDPDAVVDALGRFDAVIHLAAQISVPFGESHPRQLMADNVAGTAGALELAEAVGAREFRWASSAAVYGDPQGRLPVTEESTVAPESFYGLSKWAGERAVEHFGSARGLCTVTLRLANVYGPGQRTAGEGGVVARFMDRLAEGAPFVREGDGQQTRDFIYVGDVARSFVHRLGASPSVLLNIGTGEATSINRLGELVAQQDNRSPRWEDAPPRPADIRDSVFDPEPAAFWGFRAETVLARGLQLTWEHWRH
jgi:UDP-glucose 4-epimerase